MKLIKTMMVTSLGVTLFAACTGGNKGIDAQQIERDYGVSGAFAENQIVAEMYAQVLEHAGYTVERQLDVHVVAGGQPLGHLGGDPDTVGGELDADVMLGRVVDHLPKVRSHRGFATADVDVEHLHTFQLVDDVLALPR